MAQGEKKQHVRLPLSASADTQVDDGQVVCPNCGAGYAIDNACCPYCGGFNPIGAEKAYMEELGDIKRDTGALAQRAERGLMANLQQNARRIVVIALAVVVALAAIFLTSGSMEKQDEQQAIQNYQAREAFREQHFSELDRLYEAGDADALSAYVWDLYGDPGFDAIQTWEHYGYLVVHDDWEALTVADAHFKEEQEGIDDYMWAVSVAMRLAGLETNEWQSYASLTQEDKARVADYRAFGWTFLENTLQMDREGVAAFAESVLDERGEIDDNKLQRELEPRLKQLGTIR